MNEDYIKRVNTILEYIENNLESDLSLESVSKIAFYSPFHLHRLFKAITNETLNSYVTRKRIERAAMQLIYNKELSVSEIALQNGFSSHASFTRTFNKFYGQNPMQFRNNHFSKIGKVESKNSKANFIIEEYLCNITNLKNWIAMHAKIEIKDMPKMKVAYVTQIGTAGLEKAFERVITWARPRNLLTGSESNIVRIFHDSFKITDADKVRMSIGIVVNENVKAEGAIGITTIINAKCITGRFEIEPLDFEKYWNGLFLWMSEKGYKKADGFPFEIYYNDPDEHPERKCVVDLCIPII